MRFLGAQLAENILVVSFFGADHDGDSARCGGNQRA
jgi:hypothetical protein